MEAIKKKLKGILHDMNFFLNQISSYIQILIDNGYDDEIGV